jgi:hypothetical protein
MFLTGDAIRRVIDGQPTRFVAIPYFRLWRQEVRPAADDEFTATGPESAVR